MTSASELPRRVLVIGSTGSIGRLVVEEAQKAGYRVRAVVRDAGRTGGLPGGVEVVVGDITRQESLPSAQRRVAARRLAGGRRALRIRPGVPDAGPAAQAVVHHLHHGPVPPRQLHTDPWGRLRSRPQRPDRSGRPTGPHRADDLDRDHEPRHPVQPLHRGAGLEAPVRAARPRERAPLHDRPPGLVRLQRG